MNNFTKETEKEIKRIKKSIMKYETQNAELPKGTIYVRKIHKKSFVYRNRKINGKVISKYLGPLGKDYVDNEISLSKRYKKNSKMIRELKRKLDQMCKSINLKNNNHESLDFAININKTDSIEPSKRALKILKLLENGTIDLETYEFAIDRMYSNV